MLTDSVSIERRVRVLGPGIVGVVAGAAVEGFEVIGAKARSVGAVGLRCLAPWHRTLVHVGDVTHAIGPPLPRATGRVQWRIRGRRTRGGGRSVGAGSWAGILLFKHLTSDIAGELTVATVSTTGEAAVSEVTNTRMPARKVRRGVDGFVDLAGHLRRTPPVER